MDKQAIHITTYLPDGTQVHFDNVQELLCSKIHYTSELSSKELLDATEKEQETLAHIPYTLKPHLQEDDYKVVEIIPNEYPQIAIIQNLSSVILWKDNVEKPIIKMTEMLKGSESKTCLLFGRYAAEQQDERMYRVDLYIMNENNHS